MAPTVSPTALLLQAALLLLAADASVLLQSESAEYPAPQAVAMGDVDVNGALDAVLVDHSFAKPSLVWLANDGDALSEVEELALSVPKQFRAEGLILADYDQDGFLDIVSWSPEWLYAMRGTGEVDESTQLPVFETGELLLTIADIDRVVLFDPGDGDLPDFIVVSAGKGLQYYDQVDTGEFEARTIASAPGDREAGFTNATIADVDSDGDDDISLVLLNDTYSAVAWVNVTGGGAAFAELQELPGTRGLGSPCVPVWIDYDLDGDLDLMSATSEDTRWWENDALAFHDSHILFDEPAVLTVARDVVGDSVANVIVVTDDRTAYVDETGTAVTVLTHEEVGTPWLLLLVEFRLGNDAKPDMLLFCDSSLLVFSNYAPTLRPDLALLSADGIVVEESTFEALAQVVTDSFFGQVLCSLELSDAVELLTANGEAMEGTTSFELPLIQVATNFSFKVWPVLNFAGEVQLSLSCDVNYTSCSHDTPSDHQQTLVWNTTVFPVADLPILHMQTEAETTEDNYVNLTLALAALTDTDGSEALSVRLTALNADIFDVAFAGLAMAPAGNRSFLTAFPPEATSVAGDFSFHADEHFSGTVSLRVDVVAVELAFANAPAVASAAATVYFRPVAEQPWLDVPVALDLSRFLFFEDYSLDVDLSRRSTDDPSETLSVTVATLGDSGDKYFADAASGAAIRSAAAFAGFGAAAVFQVALEYDAVTLWAPAHEASQFDVYVSVTTTDTEAFALGDVRSAATASRAVPTVVAPVAEFPVLALGDVDAAVDEDTVMTFGILVAATADQDGSERLALELRSYVEPVISVHYQDLPMREQPAPAAEFVSVHALGVPVVTGGDLTAFPRADYSGNLDVRLTVTAVEAGWLGASSRASTDVELRVFVRPVADAPVLEVAPTYNELDEDTSFVFYIEEAALVDVDGSEFLYVEILDLYDNVDRIEYAGEPLPTSEALSHAGAGAGAWATTYLVPTGLAAGAFEVFPIEDYSGYMLLEVVATANDTTPDDVTAWDAISVSRLVNATVLPVADPVLLDMQDYYVHVPEDTRTTLIVQQLELQDLDGSEDWVVTLTDMYNTIDELTVANGSEITNVTVDNVNRTLYYVDTPGPFNITILPRRHYSGPVALNVTVLTIDNDRRFRCPVPEVNVTNTTYGQCIPAKVYDCAAAGPWNTTCGASGVADVWDYVRSGVNGTNTTAVKQPCNETVFVWPGDLWQIFNFSELTLHDDYYGVHDPYREKLPADCPITLPAANWTLGNFPALNSSLYAQQMAAFNGSLDNFTTPFADVSLCPVRAPEPVNVTEPEKWCFARALTTVAVLTDVWVIPVADVPSVNITNTTFNFLTTGAVNFSVNSNDLDLSEVMSFRAWTAHPEVTGLEVPATGEFFPLGASGNGTEVSVGLPVHQVVSQGWSLRVHVTPRWGGIAWFRLEVTVVEELNGHTAMHAVRSWSEVVALEVIHSRRNHSVAQLVMQEGADWEMLWVRPTVEPVGLLAVHIAVAKPWIEFYPQTLNYTTSDWIEPQPLLIRAIDDAVDYESHNVTAFFWANASDDARYHGKLLWDLEGVSLENDQAILRVEHELAYVQQGANYSFCVFLNTEPTHDVYVYLQADIPELNFEPPLQIHTKDNWWVRKCPLVWIEDDVEWQIDGVVSHVIETDDSAYGKLPVYQFPIYAANRTRDVSLPPEVARVHFADSLDQLIVEFDRDTDVMFGHTLLVPFNCSRLFLNETALGGADVECRWETVRVVRVALSAQATIRTGDVLVVRPGSLRAAGDSELSVVEAHGTVEPPDDPAPVATQFYAPQTVGACDNLTVVAVPSGDGNRQATYSWGVELGATSGDALDLAGLEAALDAVDGERFHLDREALDALGLGQPAAADVTLRLNFTNFLGFSSNDTLRIRFSPLPVARIEPEGTAAREVYAADELRLSVVASVPAECANLSSVAQRFEWREPSGLLGAWTETRAHFAQPGGDVLSTRRTLRLAAHSLQTGRTYTFAATSVPGDAPWLNNSASFTVRVVPAALVPVLPGGVRTLVADGQLVLNASLSYDPDDPDAELDDFEFRWGCKVERFEEPYCRNETGGIIEFERAPVVHVPFEQLTSPLYHGAHVFTVNMTRGRRTSFASVTYDLTDAQSYLRVAADAAQPVINLREGTNYTVELSGSWWYGNSGSGENDDVQTEWTLADGALDPSVDPDTIWISPRDALRVNVLSRKLTPGIEYTFRLSASAPDAEPGYADVVVRVNRPPRMGTFALSPATGYALTTSFEFTCDGWIDVDLPITYAYAHVVAAADERYRDTDLVRVVEPTELPWASAVLRLPGGGTNASSVVVAEIADRFGAVTRRELDVLVLPWTGDVAGAAEAEIPARLAAQDYAGALQRVGAAASLLAPRVVDAFYNVSFNSTITNRTYELADADIWMPCPTLNEFECSGQGVCDRWPRTCMANETYCSAVCRCDEGWFGDACYLTRDEWAAKAGVRLWLAQVANWTAYAAEPSLHFMLQTAEQVAQAAAAPDEVPAEMFGVAMDVVTRVSALAVEYLSSGEAGVIDVTRSVLDAASAIIEAGVFRGNSTTAAAGNATAAAVTGSRRLLQLSGEDDDEVQVAPAQDVATQLHTAAHDLLHLLMFGALADEEPVFVPSRQLSLFGKRRTAASLVANATALPQFRREADNDYPLHWTYMNWSIVDLAHDDRWTLDSVFELHGLRFHSDPYDAYTHRWRMNSDVVSVSLREPGSNAEVNVSGLHSPIRFQVANRVHIPLDDAPQVIETQCRHEGHNVTFDCVESVGVMHHICVNNTLIEFRCPVYATRPTCHWWDAEQARWSRSGCWLEQYTPAESVCRCDHISDFASKHETVLLEDYHFLYPVAFEPPYNTPDQTVILVVLAFVYVGYVVLAVAGGGWDRLDLLAFARSDDVDAEHSWLQEQAQLERQQLAKARAAGDKSVPMPELGARQRRFSVARLVGKLAGVRRRRVKPRGISDRWWLLQNPLRVFRDSNHVVLGFVFSRVPTFSRPQRATSALAGCHMGALVLALTLDADADEGVLWTDSVVTGAAVAGSLCMLVVYYAFAAFFTRCSERTSDIYDSKAIAAREALVQQGAFNRLLLPEDQKGEPQNLDQAEQAVFEAEDRFEREARRLRNEFMRLVRDVRDVAQAEDEHRRYLHRVQRARTRVMDARNVYYRLREEGRQQRAARLNAIERQLAAAAEPAEAGERPLLGRLRRWRLAFELELEMTPVHPTLEVQHQAELAALRQLRSFHLRIVHAYLNLRRFRVNRAFASRYNRHVYALAFAFNGACLAFILPWGRLVATSIMQAYWRGLTVMVVFALALFQPAFILFVDWVVPQLAAYAIKAATLGALDLDPEGDARREAEERERAAAEWAARNPPPKPLPPPKPPVEGPKVAEQPGVVGADSTGGVFEIADQFINLVTGKEGMALCPRGCGMTFIGRKQAVRHTQECVRDTDCPLGCGVFLTPWAVPQHVKACKNRQVTCPYQGCGFECREEMMAGHQATCHLRVLECEQCGEVMQAGELMDHTRDAHESFPCSLGCGEYVHRDLWAVHKRECPERIIECPLLCGNMFRAAEREAHETGECRNRVLACENDCGRMVRFNGMQGHLQHLCPYRDVTCEYCHRVFGACELSAHHELDCTKLSTCGECDARLPPALLVVHIADVHDSYKMVPCPKGCGTHVRYPYRFAHAEICQGRRGAGALEGKRRAFRADKLPENDPAIDEAAAKSRRARSRAASIVSGTAGAGDEADDEGAAGASASAGSGSASGSPEDSGGSAESSPPSSRPSSASRAPPEERRQRRQRRKERRQQQKKKKSLRESSRVVPDDVLLAGFADEPEQVPRKACTHYGCGELVPEDELAAHRERCRFAPRTCTIGCGAVFPAHLERLHDSLCDMRPAACGACGQRMQHRHLEVHERSNCRVQVCDCGHTAATAELLAAHRAACPLRSVRCQLGCGELLPQAEREAHERQRCPRRCVMCECSAPMPALELEAHRESECPLRQLPCRNGCGAVLNADELENHENWGCELLLVRCECLRQLRMRERGDHLKECRTFQRRWADTRRRVRNMAVNELRRRVQRVMHMGHADELVSTTALLEYDMDPVKASSQLRRGDADVIKAYLALVAELQNTAKMVPPAKELAGAETLERVYTEVVQGDGGASGSGSAV